MKVLLIAVVSIIILASCSENIEDSRNVSHNVQNKNERFIIPDYINIKRELIAAAYREVHPQDAYVIIVYNDTTQITATKMSYINDSIFEVKDLIKIYYNQFRLKDDSTETYTITDTTVAYMHQSGIFAMNAEYPRVDIE